jgi:hypothetical protein
MKTYYPDPEKLTLAMVRKRLEATDLVPSRVPLLSGINKKFAALQKAGISNLAKLAGELKNTRRLEATAEKTGISPDYLVLLRRETGSWFPKPPLLREFDWLPGRTVEVLVAEKLRSAADLFEAISLTGMLQRLLEIPGVEGNILEELLCYVDLARIQWVSPTVARMLIEAGYPSAVSVAGADVEALAAALDVINKRKMYYRGKIGVRDIGRLVTAAGFVVEQEKLSSDVSD